MRKKHLTKRSEKIIPKKTTTKLVYHGLFCNSQRSLKTNTVMKLKTKKNTLFKIKFSWKNKCVGSFEGISQRIKG